MLNGKYPDYVEANPEKIVRDNPGLEFFVTYCKTPFDGIESLMDAVLETEKGSLVVMTPTISAYNDELKRALKKGGIRLRLYEIAFATHVVLQQRARRFTELHPDVCIMFPPRVWREYGDMSWKEPTAINSDEFFG
jgi:hypothetical protein